MYFFDIGHPCYDELTPVKTEYPLTSIQVYNLSRSHDFFDDDRWPGAGFPIGSRAHGKQGRIGLKLD